MGGVGQWLADRLAAERERWLLWLPVGVGVGAALFFALPVDPPPYLAAGLAVLCLPGVWLGRARPGLLVLSAAALALALGFAAAEWRAASQNTVMLTRPRGPLPLTGRVVAVEGSEKSARLTLDQVKIGGEADGARSPQQVRLRLAADWDRPPPGAVVTLRARLLPSSPPTAPGAFDFQRHAYFAGIGAVGFAASPPEIIAPPPPRFGGGLGLEMERWREIIAARVSSVLDGGAGGIAGALLHGEQTAVPADAMQAMRDSGLAHLLSISGLHIGLVAGIVIYVVRAALALIPFIALRWPTQKIAAACGLAAAIAYTALVGVSAPTIRSTLMTGLALAAVMADRNPFSMRLVGFAAVVVMLFVPDSLTGPSFQMSFAAVVALIAAFEVISPPLARWRAGFGPVWRAGMYMAMLAVTSIIASLATAPFSIYHFQSVALYGVLANMVAVPLTGVWIMPLCLLVYALLPLGWEGPALMALGWGVDVILRIAEITAALPGAVLAVPAMPLAGLILTVVGGLWLCLWRQNWRLWGLPLLLAGLLSPWLTTPPDILVSEDGTLMGARLADGRLALSNGRAEKFTAENWRRRDGESRAEIAAAAPLWPTRGQSDDGRLTCDAEACLYRFAEYRIAFVRRPGALAEECAAAQAVITSLQTGRRCKAALVIDDEALRRGGAHALYLRPDGGIEARTVNAERGERPWTR